MCNATYPITKLGNSAVPATRGFEETGSERSDADRIVDFLNGRTHGEDLFHELYDYVLSEPIPHRMRILLRNA